MKQWLGGQGRMFTVQPSFTVNDSDAGGSAPTPGSPEAGVPLVEGGNPAWNDFLQYVPEEERTKVVPVLEKWDENYNKVQQEYAPWDSVIKSGLDPETVQFSTEVLAALQEDPRKIYDSLGEHFNWSQKEVDDAVEAQEEINSQGPQNGEEQQFNIEDFPAFQEMQQKNELMAQILLQQRQQEVDAQEDAALETELKAATTKHGEFDEEYVLARMAQTNETVDDAVQGFFEFVDKYGGGVKKAAPRLHAGSGGGAVPTPRLDTKTMGDKDVRALIANTLAASNQEG